MPLKTCSPSVSLILIALEEDGRLLDCIKNILAQTYSNFELIVLAISSNVKIMNKFHDFRINLIDSSYIHSFNQLAGLIKGEFIVRINMDKIIFPEYLETLYEFMISNPCVDICGECIEGGSLSGASTFPTSHNAIILQMLCSDAIFESFSIIKKSLSYQLINEVITPNTNKFDLWLNLYRHGAQFVITRNVLCEKLLSGDLEVPRNYLSKNRLINYIVEKIKKSREDIFSYVQMSAELYEKGAISINTIIAVFKSIPKL